MPPAGRLRTLREWAAFWDADTLMASAGRLRTLGYWEALWDAEIYPDTLRRLLQVDDERLPTSQTSLSVVEIPLEVLGSATIWVYDRPYIPHEPFAMVYLGTLEWAGGWLEPITIRKLSPMLEFERLPERQMKIWTTLNHPRIVPLLGHGRFDSETAVVTPYFTNVKSYLQNHPEVDTRRLIMQVAEGLEYVHNQMGIVHGDLKVDAVSINAHGNAMIAGFELSTSIIKVDLTATVIRGLHTARYAAPELVSVDCSVSKTTESDIYAFGMLVYEIIAGRPPWEGISQLGIIAKAIEGQRPLRPEGSQMSDSMWNLCVACWDEDPAKRPRIADILAGLRGPGPHSDLPAPVQHMGSPTRVPFEHPPTGEIPESTLGIVLGKVYVEIVLPTQTPMRGGFGKVLKGYTRVHGVEMVVAVKTCPTYKVPAREYSIWKSLSHKNILPLYGGIEPQVAMQQGLPECVFVSPYMSKGNLADYLKFNPQVLRLPIMMDVATGLAYLHNTVKIVHGDIKAENVLIADNGRAVLADFGLSTTVFPGPQLSGSQAREVYTLAYAAPEIIDDNAVDPSAPGVLRSKTKMSDMYAYGVLLYQAYAGGFGRNMRARILLIAAMHEGRLPKRPIGLFPVLCDDLWSICRRCWARDPKKRPSVARVLGELRDLESSPGRKTIETPEPDAPQHV